MASITGNTLQEQIQKAIVAHGVFKFRLAHMVEAETGEMAPITVGADYHCPVGKWLTETVSDEDRRTEHCRKVAELHTRFHRAAGEVAALSVARRRTEALEAMEPTSTFKKASDQLIQALEAWAEATGTEGWAAPAVAEEAPAAEAPEAGEAGQPSEADEAAEASEPQPAATEPEGESEELPPGWWRLSPAALAAEVDQIEGHGEHAETGQPAGAEEQAQPADSDEKGDADDISDWFGLPKSSDRE